MQILDKFCADVRVQNVTWPRDRRSDFRKLGIKRCARLERKKSWKGVSRSAAVARQLRISCRGGSNWPPPPVKIGLMFLQSSYAKIFLQWIHKKRNRLTAGAAQRPVMSMMIIPFNTPLWIFFDFWFFFFFWSRKKKCVGVPQLHSRASAHGISEHYCTNHWHYLDNGQGQRMWHIDFGSVFSLPLPLHPPSPYSLIFRKTPYSPSFGAEHQCGGVAFLCWCRRWRESHRTWRNRHPEKENWWWNWEYLINHHFRNLLESWIKIFSLG